MVGVHSKISIKQCEKALRNAGGFVTHAAKQLPISYQSLQKRIKNSQYLPKVMAEIIEQDLDFCETQLKLAIKNKDLKAITYYLDRKGKHRGYGSTVGVTGDNGEPLEIVVKLEK